MKILSVRLENLNSLRGKHFIDFTDPAFASGLFAITGPTGAGKSTVLDAICLALFHRTPRQDNVSQGQNELMSTGLGECSAEVEFATGGKGYRATWTQHRSRKTADGALQPPKASLSDLDGNLLTERAGQTELAISTVLGLSFDQFSRSVLLAQGGFDAFLKARDNERAELLEKLTGTEVYGEISKAVHERNREQAEGLRLLRGQQGNITLMGEEELALVQTALEEAQTAHASLEVQRKGADVALQWLKALEGLVASVERAVADLAQVEQESQVAQPQLGVLALGEKAEPFRSAHEGLLRAHAHQSTCQQHLKGLRDTHIETAEVHRTATWRALSCSQGMLKASQEALDRHKLAIGRVGDETVSLGVDSRLGENLVAWRQLDKAVSVCVSQWQEDKGNAATATEAVKFAEQRIVEARAFAEQKSAQLQETTVALESAQRELAQAQGGKTRDDVLSEVHRLQARRGSLEALKPIFARRGRATEQHAATTERLDREKASEPGLKATSDRLLNELGAAKTLRTTLNTAVDQARHIRSLAEERDGLAPGAPCPLCGSSEHPAIDQYKEVDPAPFEQQLRIQEGIVEALDGQLAQARAEHQGCQARLANAEGELATQADGMAATEAEWSDACLALEVNPDNDEELEDLIQGAVGVHAKADQLRGLVIQREGLVSTAKLTCEAATAAHRGAAEQLSLREASRIAAAKAETEARGRVDQAATRVEHARDELREALPGAVLPANMTQWLVDQGAVWTRYGELSAQHTQLQEQLPTLQHEGANAGESAKRWMQAWERGEWGEPAPIEVPPDRFARSVQEVETAAAALMRLTGQLQAGEQQLEQAEATTLSAAQEWVGAVDASGFSSREELVGAFLAPAELERLREVRNCLERRRVQAQAVHVERSAQLAAHREDPKTDKLKGEVQAELDRLTAEAGALQGQVIHHATCLQTDRELRQTWTGLLAQIEIAQRDHDDWQHLNGLVGSANGQLFRRFAQGLTLDRLVYLANKHLRSLDGGHFSVARGATDLGLVVEDAWDAGARRDASTLSGGESFLVSLALALGLSDLVSQNIQIDSFFLDEGFGTLDPDALAQAMDAIESLNASGKLIGVISHVDAVKDRIPVQIKVVPTSRPGSSRLELPVLG